MDDSLVDCQPVHERLERRSRRAFRTRTVDLAGNRVFEEIRRTDRRDDFHRPIVDQHRTGVVDSPGPPAIDVSVNLPLEKRLAAEVQRRGNRFLPISGRRED